jgi:hypothetical protein
MVPALSSEHMKPWLKAKNPSAPNITWFQDGEVFDLGNISLTIASATRAEI